MGAELRMPTHRGRVPGLPIVLPGWGDPCANFLVFGTVVFWGFGVRCGRMKLVSSRNGSIWGVSDELRMPTHKGEGTWATHSFIRLGRPLRKFLEVRCGSFLGFCGPVRSGETCLFQPWLHMGGQCRITDAHPYG